MDFVLDELCTLSDCLSNQLPMATSSTHKLALRNKFKYLLLKSVAIYDELMSKVAEDVSVQSSECELTAESSVSHVTSEASGDQASQVGSSDSKQLSFKAPIPKGRLLEIIALLQRASERQNQTDCQDETKPSPTVEEEKHSPLSPRRANAKTATDMSTPIQHNCSQTSTTESAYTFSSLPQTNVAEWTYSRSEKLGMTHSVNNDTTSNGHRELQKYTEPSIPTSSSLSEDQSSLRHHQSSLHHYQSSLRHDQCRADTMLLGDLMVTRDNLEPPPPPLPPPPPPISPPAPGLITLQRVAQHEPSVPLKPLFWKRLQYSALEVRGQDIIWSNISEPVLREMEEFEKLFQKKAQNKRRSKNTSHVARESNLNRPIRLLDGQRSQAVAIVMKSLHVDLEEITQSLVAMEMGVVDVESLRALNEMKATDEELQKIKGHLHGNSCRPLDKPEMFLYQLSLIPNFAKRLRCLLFSCTFANSASSMKQKLSSLQKACHSLRHSKPLHDVLALTLALGNVMNSGSKVRGHADGFHLGVLPQLMDIKATQATSTSVQTTPTITTLLHFIVSYFVKYKCAGLTTFPLPDLSTILAASQIQFDELYSELGLLTVQLDVAKSDLQVIVEDASPEPVATTPLELAPTTPLVFRKQMKQFLSQSAVQLKDLSVILGESKKLFKSTVSYFCVEAPCGERCVSPTHFFGLWSPFLREFQQLWNIEIKNRAMARQKAAQLERWDGVVVKPVSQAGLKSRLKLLQTSSTTS